MENGTQENCHVTAAVERFHVDARKNIQQDPKELMLTVIESIADIVTCEHNKDERTIKLFNSLSTAKSVIKQINLEEVAAHAGWKQYLVALTQLCKIIPIDHPEIADLYMKIEARVTE